MSTPHIFTAKPTALTAEEDRPPRVMLTVEDAAEQLSLSRTRLYQLLKSGEIGSVKVGRLRRVPADALVTYVKRITAAQHAA